MGFLVGDTRVARIVRRTGKGDTTVAPALAPFRKCCGHGYTILVLEEGRAKGKSDVPSG
jgi:hypothetical protein